MSYKSIRILLTLWLLACVGASIYEAATRFPVKLRTNIDYGIFGELEGPERWIVKIDPGRLTRILDSLHRLPRGAMPCGYDYYLKIYRHNSSNIIISVNTECHYLTIHDTDGRTNLRSGVFYSLRGPFYKWIKRLSTELGASRSYLYTFKVPISLRFNELSARIGQFEKCSILEPDSREGERNPHISLEYSDDLSNYPNLPEADATRFLTELGRLEPDNRFFMMINDERLRNRIASLSLVRNRQTSYFKDRVTFFRSMEIFIEGTLLDEEIEALKGAWETVNGKNTFGYSADTKYTIEVVTDKLLKDAELLELKERYGIRESRLP